jgi:hypothetical protein
MVWTILMAGVVLSFLDVLYIMKQLDDSPWTELKEESDSYLVEEDTPDNTQKSIKVEDVNVSEVLAKKGPIMDLLKDAGISFDPVEDLDLLVDLPDWADVVQLYGPEPVIYGLNEGNCQRFIEHSDVGDHLIGVAGAFNSGTNLLAELLIHNCRMPNRQKKYGWKQQGVRWQVPWGKHTPPGDKEYRQAHKTKKDANIDANEIMPMVTIRDPLIWLKSMCKHRYTARWYNPDNKRCPNFSVHTTAVIKYADFSRIHEVRFYAKNNTNPINQLTLHPSNLRYRLCRAFCIIGTIFITDTLKFQMKTCQF